MLNFYLAYSNNSYFIACQSELILMIGEIRLTFKSHAVHYCVVSLYPIVVVIHGIVLHNLGVWRILWPNVEDYFKSIGLPWLFNISSTFLLIFKPCWPSHPQIPVSNTVCHLNNMLPQFNIILYCFTEQSTSNQTMFYLGNKRLFLR